MLIDYGAGNLHSVHKALAEAGMQVERVARPEEAVGADALVLPGQGHFRQVMSSFRTSGFEELVREHLAQSKPFLGICVGLQLLMSTSEEAPGVAGLGILAGEVKRFEEPGLPVPHMGWNRLRLVGRPPLLAGIADGAFAYFAHSYYVAFSDHNLDGTTTTYGSTTFLSTVAADNLCATQFHPEKSQGIGLKLLVNFRRLAERTLAGTRS